jgi:hypothetical protein
LEGGGSALAGGDHSEKQVHGEQDRLDKSIFLLKAHSHPNPTIAFGRDAQKGVRELNQEGEQTLSFSPSKDDLLVDRQLWEPRTRSQALLAIPHSGTRDIVTRVKVFLRANSPRQGRRAVAVAADV